MAKEAAELLSSLESQQAFKLDLREFFEGWFFGEVQSYHSPTNETWKEWNLKMIWFDDFQVRFTSFSKGWPMALGWTDVSFWQLGNHSSNSNENILQSEEIGHSEPSTWFLRMKNIYSSEELTCPLENSSGWKTIFFPEFKGKLHVRFSGVYLDLVCHVFVFSKSYYFLGYYPNIPHL